MLQGSFHHPMARFKPTGKHDSSSCVLGKHSYRPSACVCVFWVICVWTKSTEWEISDFHHLCLCSLGWWWGLLRYPKRSQEGRPSLWGVTEGFGVTSLNWLLSVFFFFFRCELFSGLRGSMSGLFTSGGKQITALGGLEMHTCGLLLGYPNHPCARCEL